jgi:hypothetical protein
MLVAFLGDTPNVVLMGVFLQASSPTSVPATLLARMQKLLVIVAAFVA